MCHRMCVERDVCVCVLQPGALRREIECARPKSFELTVSDHAENRVNGRAKAGSHQQVAPPG